MLFLIRPSLLGELKGTFQKRSVPTEYIDLKNRLHVDAEFYRTLWVPRQQRFTFSSSIHPSIEAEPLFSSTDSASLAKKIQSSNAEQYISELGVKYIIIPYDPFGEIFIDDRKYSQKIRDSYERVFDKIPWIKKVEDGKITIYEIKKQKELFWLESNNGKISYDMISPTKYKLFVKGVKKGDTVIFSENYNSYWKANIDQSVIDSSIYQTNKKFSVVLNKFVLPKDGSYIIDLYYFAEKYYIIGRVISGVSLILLIILLFKLQRILRHNK